MSRSSRSAVALCVVLVATLTVMWSLTAAGQPSNPVTTPPGRSSLPQASQQLTATSPASRACWDWRADTTKFLLCAQGALVTETYTDGAAVALADLRIIRDNDQELAYRCHNLAHAVGRAAYWESGTIDGALAIDRGADCQWGFMHGAIEEWALSSPQATVLSDAADVCTASDIEARSQCIHGLGHAIALAVNDDMGTAVSACDPLPLDERPRCGSGVMMEYATSWREHSEGIPAPQPGTPGGATVSPELARNPCAVVTDVYLLECFERLSNFWGPLVGSDIDMFFDWCAQVPDGYVDACARSAGEWVALHVAATDKDQAVSICTRAPVDQRRGCWRGIISSLSATELAAGLPLTSICGSLGEDRQWCLELEAELVARGLQPDVFGAQEFIPAI